jgi:hypothetical protein
MPIDLMPCTAKILRRLHFEGDLHGILYRYIDYNGKVGVPVFDSNIMDVRVLPKGLIVDVFAITLPHTKTERDPRFLGVKMAHYGAAARHLPDCAYVSIKSSHRRAEINEAYQEDFKNVNGRECQHYLLLDLNSVKDIFPNM